MLKYVQYEQLRCMLIFCRLSLWTWIVMFIMDNFASYNILVVFWICDTFFIMYRFWEMYKRMQLISTIATFSTFQFRWWQLSVRFHVPFNYICLFQMPDNWRARGDWCTKLLQDNENWIGKSMISHMYCSMSTARKVSRECDIFWITST